VSSPSSGEVAAALRELAERIDALEPALTTIGAIGIRASGELLNHWLVSMDAVC
jgi:hypothetical protein